MAEFRSTLDATSSIAAIQDEVITSLKGADDSLEFRTTGYFNHTYVPDVVMRWRNKGEERQVFLRTSDNDDYLQEDIGLLNDKDPIFVPLNGLASAGRLSEPARDPDLEDTSPSKTKAPQEERPFEGTQALHDTSVSARALVAQPGTLRTLAAVGQTERINSLAARAVLQGGAGVLSPNDANAFSEAIAEGFRGALVGDEEATQEALRASLDVLDGQRTAQVAELLQAAWVGGGQIGASFPGLGLGGNPLEPDALLLLLDTVSVDDFEFWKRLSRNLDFRHFDGLTVSAENQGFQQLMRAAAPRLKAKAARTISVSESDELTDAIWALNAGTLSLRVGRARVDFAPRSANELPSAGFDARPSVDSLVRRATRADLHVLRVVITNGDRSLEYASEDGTSIVSDPNIESIGGDFEGSTVARAVVAVEGRDLNINLETSTGSGHTRSMFYVSSLAQSLVPLVMDLDESEKDTLQTIFVTDDDASPATDSGGSPGGTGDLV